MCVCSVCVCSVCECVSVCVCAKWGRLGTEAKSKIYVHVLMRDERRKEERSKQGQTNNKAKQHSTPEAV